MSGFTPGPWELVTNQYGEHVVAAADANVFLLDDTESTVHDYDEYTANARLIAAAPELYEALHNALDMIVDAARDGTYSLTEFGHLKAALAKARGEQA